MREVGKPEYWWVVAALGPMWLVLYAAALAAPVPEWLPRPRGVLATLVQAVAVGLVIPAIVPLIVFPAVLLYGVTARVFRRDWTTPFRWCQVGPKVASLSTLLVWTSLYLKEPLFELRYWAASACAERAEDILSALKTYKRDHGHYPEQLDQLVPAYLRAVPLAGAFAYSDWQYRKGDGKQLFGEFELSLSMLYGSSGDRLFYWANRRYPEIVYSGSVVPLGDWAYTRE